jgi:hypothetical protein
MESRARYGSLGLAAWEEDTWILLKAIVVGLGFISLGFVKAIKLED